MGDIVELFEEELPEGYNLWCCEDCESIEFAVWTTPDGLMFTCASCHSLYDEDSFQE